MYCLILFATTWFALLYSWKNIQEKIPCLTHMKSHTPKLLNCNNWILFQVLSHSFSSNGRIISLYSIFGKFSRRGQRFRGSNKQLLYANRYMFAHFKKFCIIYDFSIQDIIWLEHDQLLHGIRFNIYVNVHAYSFMQLLFIETRSRRVLSYKIRR